MTTTQPTETEKKQISFVIDEGASKQKKTVKTEKSEAPKEQEKTIKESEVREISQENKTNIDNSLKELLENFDPKKDRLKLSAKQRSEIITSEKKYRAGVVSIKDLIAPSSMEISPYKLKINNQWARSFFIYNYPRFLDVGWLDQIINFEAKIDISMFIYPENSAEILKTLRKKVAEMLSTKHISERKGIVNDTGLDTALEDAEQLRVDLQRGTEKFYQVGIYFTLYAETEELLDKTSEKLQTIFGGQMIMTRPTDFRTERGFNSTLPQGTDELCVLRNMNTSPLSTGFPFISNNLTSDNGILYGLNRHNNSLIIFDRFKLENANSVIFAKSGAGKSYAVKLEILRSLIVGSDVMIIDPENEYEDLCTAVGGSYARISLNSKHRINPFDLPMPNEGDSPDEYDTQAAIRESVISLTGLIKVMLGKLSSVEDGILDKALQQVYEVKGINAETKKAYEYEMPTMIDLQKVLETFEGGNELAVRLERFTRGTFSGLFSKQTNINLNSGLLCFCVRDLEDSLRPIAMYILLNFIWGKVRSELKKRLLIIDEAWNIVQHEDSARFLHNLVKRARKYYLGISTITQDTEDFLGSKWGKPIITNSSMQILLKQAPSAMETLSKVFNLTEGERYLLLNSEVGQGLFFAGSQHVAIQVIASKGEHKIVTTNPEEQKNKKK